MSLINMIASDNVLLVAFSCKKMWPIIRIASNIRLVQGIKSERLTVYDTDDFKKNIRHRKDRCCA